MDFFFETLKANYAEAFNLVRDAIRALPDEEWYKADIDHLIPARLCFHALELFDWAMHFPAQKPGTNAFNLNWGVRPAESLPNRIEMLGYLGNIQGKVNAFLDCYSDRPEERHEKEGGVYPFSALHLSLYALRHLQLCQGQMSAEIRRRGIEWEHWCW